MEREKPQPWDDHTGYRKTESGSADLCGRPKCWSLVASRWSLVARILLYIVCIEEAWPSLAGPMWPWWGVVARISAETAEARRRLLPSFAQLAPVAWRLQVFRKGILFLPYLFFTSPIVLIRNEQARKQPIHNKSVWTCAKARWSPLWWSTDPICSSFWPHNNTTCWVSLNTTVWSFQPTVGVSPINLRPTNWFTAFSRS